MKRTVVYIHGMGGSAGESVFYAPLFPECDVTGLDYRSFTPWDAGEEIRASLAALACKSGKVAVIANSIGAYFLMVSGAAEYVDEAFFISPVVDMESVIRGMMDRAGVTDEELFEKHIIQTAEGELSSVYLDYVKAHPPMWDIPTHILYGSLDALVAREDVERFATVHGADLTVMENGEHWFHTPEQHGFIREWISRFTNN